MDKNISPSEYLDQPKLKALKKSRISPINQRRWTNFKANRRGYWSLWVFLFLFFLCFIILSIALNLTGLDNLTAISAAASAMANVGPGLGQMVGPTGTYEQLSDIAKWLLSFGMLLGRLELFTVLVMFTPAFWRA